MKRIIQFLLTLGFLLLSFTNCSKIKERAIVIKAGDKSWTLREVQNYFHFRSRKAFLGEMSPEKLKKELVHEIFLRSLVENWAKKNKIPAQKITLTEEEKSRFSSSKEQLRALRDHKGYLSLYNLLLRDFAKKTPTPTREEQKKFYNEHRAYFVEPASCRLKQIVVSQKQLAHSLLQRLNQGESFDSLHKLYSTQKHPGWVKKGDLNIFDRVCFNTSQSLSSVLKSLYGYHIFLVEERRPRRQKTFLSVKKRILQELKARKAKEQFQSWLKKELFSAPLFIDKKLLDKIHIQYKKNEI